MRVPSALPGPVAPVLPDPNLAHGGHEDWNRRCTSARGPSYLTWASSGAFRFSIAASNCFLGARTATSSATLKKPLVSPRTKVVSLVPPSTGWSAST
jgi:hypothetical protein